MIERQQSGWLIRALSITTVLLVWSGCLWFFWVMQKQHQNYTARVAAISAELAGLTERRALAKTYADAYLSLLTPDHNPSNPTIAWMESIETTISQPGVTSSRYRFSTPVRLASAQGEIVTTIDVEEHLLQFSATVLHDAHLLKLLDRILDQAGSLVENRGCDIRIHANELQLNCLFSFYSVHPKVTDDTVDVLIGSEGVG